MKRCVLGLLLVLVSSLPLFSQAEKKRVAVMNFEFGAVQNWWGTNNWDIGKGISDLIVDNLVNDGTYRVMERKALDTIMAEQNFSNSDRADPATAAKIGKLLGVNAIIVGSVTQFGAEKKGTNVGALAGKWGGFGGGKVGTEKGIANVNVTARMVDVNTGEILASTTGKGQSQRSGLLLGGIGAGHGGFGAGDISMTSKDFQETILGEATMMAVKQLSQELVHQNSKLPEAPRVQVRGLVADVSGRSVVLNVGSSQGVKIGAQLKVLRVTRTVKDPATGKVLREITSEMGTVRVDEADASSSSGTVVSGSDIKVGDLVRGD
jgi:curli biogenesis system outer membrane secretion channel CsgG